MKLALRKALYRGLYDGRNELLHQCRDMALNTNEATLQKQHLIPLMMKALLRRDSLIGEANGDVAQLDRVGQVLLGHRGVVALVGMPDGGADAERQEAGQDEAKPEPGMPPVLVHHIPGCGHPGFRSDQMERWPSRGRCEGMPRAPSRLQIHSGGR